MIERHIEVQSPGSIIRKSRGRLSIRTDEGDDDEAAIPLDTIGNLTLHRGTLVSVAAILAVMHEGGSVVLCGDSFEPEGLVWSLEGHHVQARRLEAQIEASKPLRKRVWQAIVVRKIEAQAEILRALVGSDALRGLTGRVGSGDPLNIEAQAARRYWPLVLGSEFRRGDQDNPINGLLNYGYAIVRSALARAVASVGLHPSIAVHHRDARNAFALVDDLIEPYRPMVDFAVANLVRSGARVVDHEVKVRLSEILVSDLSCDVGNTPVFAAVRRTALSLAQSFEERVVALDYPLSMLPC